MKIAKTILCIWVCVMFDLPFGGTLAHASGMRCGGRLVSPGDPIYRVEARCGPPDSTSSWVEYRSVRTWVGRVWVERMVEVKYEEWIYDLGPERFIRYVVFENGRLAGVTTGPYGEGRY